MKQYELGWRKAGKNEAIKIGLRGYVIRILAVINTNGIGVVVRLTRG
jgi:hypothetical protein